MALDFPANPVDGQVYPDPPQPGVTQYQWNSDKGTWLAVFAGVRTVTAIQPLYNEGSPTDPILGINPATTSQGGYMTAADKRKLEELTPASGTVTAIKAGRGLGAPLTNETITTSGTLDLLPPSPTTIGGVKEGAGVQVLADGSLSLKPPSSITLGGVKAGAGVSISPDGTISVDGGGLITVLDNIAQSFNGSTTSFQMTTSGVPFSPATTTSLLIFVGGVMQVPNVAFTTASSQITFTGPPPAGASFYGISFS
jgi:hypothetical protein